MVDRINQYTKVLNELGDSLMKKSQIKMIEELFEDIAREEIAFTYYGNDGSRWNVVLSRNFSFKVSQAITSQIEGSRKKKNLEIDISLCNND